MFLPKRLFLLGDIGCGKSSMLCEALGASVSLAGGFRTVRVVEQGRLTGFELLASDGRRGRFCDLTQGIRRDDSVFSGLGAELLREAARHPFAVLDEFGGMELLVPEFRAALFDFLRSDVPCIGVLKNEQAVQALLARIPLDSPYEHHLQTLRALLEADPDTRLLSTTGWQDEETMAVLRQWVKRYGEC